MVVTKPNDPRQARRICLTPTRNESWIIEHFLAATKTWADDIIVADQGSSDGTREVIARAPNTILVRNDSPAYDECHRQTLLLAAARTIPGKRILLGLDADEALSANAAESKEWDQIENARPGTVLRFRWVNLLPGFQKAWIRPGHVALGFVDDGAEHMGKRIHSPRVPHPEGAPVLDLQEIVVLHFQFVVWDRMQSKQRWYQAWEHIKHQQKGPLEIYRQYNHMHGGWKDDEIVPVQPEWLTEYERNGIDFHSLKCEPVTWWDREIIEMLRAHSPAHFKRIAIWDKDWLHVAQQLGLSGANLRDPRSGFDRFAHRMLAATQASRGNWIVRCFERFLRLRGW